MSRIQCVMPLCGYDENDDPEIIGSGVLLKVASRTFLVTATHVFTDNKDSTLCYPGTDGLEELTGNRIGADRDEEDVSVMLLDDSTAKDISFNYSALPLFFIDMNDITTKGDRYDLVGFPEDLQTTSLESAVLRSQQLRYHGSAAPDRTYRKCEVTRVSHIVVDHSKNKASDVDANTVKPPSMNCMSGGAVWKRKESDPSLFGLRPMRLVGIMIEKHDRWAGVVSTRINYVIEAIRSEFPELSSILPHSSTVSVEVNKKSEEQSYPTTHP